MVLSCHVIKHCFLCCHLIAFFPSPIPGMVRNGLTVQSWWHHRGSNSESSPWKGDVFTNSTMVPYNPPKYLYRAGRIFLLVVRHIWIQTCQTFIFFCSNGQNEFFKEISHFAAFVPALRRVYLLCGISRCVLRIRRVILPAISIIISISIGLRTWPIDCSFSNQLADNIHTFFWKVTAIGTAFEKRCQILHRNWITFRLLHLVLRTSELAGS